MNEFIYELFSLYRHYWRDYPPNENWLGIADNILVFYEGITIGFLERVKVMDT